MENNLRQVGIIHPPLILAGQVVGRLKIRRKNPSLLTPWRLALSLKRVIVGTSWGPTRRLAQWPNWPSAEQVVLENLGWEAGAAPAGELQGIDKGKPGTLKVLPNPPSPPFTSTSLWPAPRTRAGFVWTPFASLKGWGNGAGFPEPWKHRKKERLK